MIDPNLAQGLGNGPKARSMFFRSHAAELGLESSSFFLPPTCLKTITALQKRYFPAR